MHKRDTMTKIKKQVGRFCLGLGLLGLAQLAQAAPLSGKVFLDYDDTGTNTNAPLAGLAVELLDNSGTPLSPPLTTTTGADGSYSFNTPTLGSFKVKAETTNSESQTLNVAVSGAGGISGQNVFLKGSGGNIQLRISDNLSTGAKNIPVTFSVSGYADIDTVTDSTGYININNTLTGVTYQATVLPSDIVDDLTNAKKYALWDATLANGSHAYVDNITFTMTGTNQTGSFNVRERNEWGGDGVVAVDQDGNGIYSQGIDTPVEGITVDLYYQGTTTKVLGTSTITTGANGKYNFKNLPLGDYTVKLTNATSPWVLVTADNANFSIAVATGNPSAFNFLLDVDPNDTTMATVYGYVFSVGDNETMQRGPDSGQVLNQNPTSSSTILSLPLDLYQHDGTNWVKISSITSKSSSSATGTYAFKGLPKNKDYKVKIASDSSVSGSYVFSTDFDGKSPTRHVVLSSGANEPIAGKEIVLVGLNSTKKNHNFIYSNKTTVQIYSHFLANNIWIYDGGGVAISAWGNVYYGLPIQSLSPSYKVKLYEEDGVTPVNNKSGTPAEWWILSSDKNRYGLITQSKTDVDHKSVYVMKVIDYDATGYPAGASSIQSSIYVNTKALYTQNPLTFKGSNKIEGTLFLNKSHSGGFVSGTDTPLLGIEVNLYRLRAGTTSTWDLVTISATNKGGKYGFVNLPNGQYKVKVGKLGPLSPGSSAIMLEGDVDSSLTLGEVSANLTSSNTAVANRDIWYKLTNNDYIFKGKVFLDTLNNDGKITAVGDNRLYDLSLPQSTVLLCNDSGNEANCKIGGSDYIAHQVTGVNGKYEFNSTTTPTLAAGTNYLVKAYRDDVVMYNNANVSSSYSVSTPVSGYDLPVTNNFLAKGNTTQPARYHGWIGNDVKGDQLISIPEAIGWHAHLQYWDTTTSNWVTWDTIGHQYAQFDIRNLPAGKYRHYYDSKIGDPNWVADMSPSIPTLGHIEFEILPNGTMADGLPNIYRNVYLARDLPAGVTKAIDGGIYLDITGSGVKDESSVLLPGSFLSGVSVKGFFTPRIYPNYSLNPMSVLNSGTPDFEDTNVATNNGAFAYTAANKVLNLSRFNYSNYLLSLEGLSSNFTIIGNSGYQKSYLPSAILGDKQYMQVDGLQSGVTNQYWLVRLNVPTEISGRLYYDLDDNGEYNPGDSPMTGVRVELWKDGAFYSHMMTDNEGIYKFTGVIDGNYEVKVTSTGLDSLYEVKDPSSGVISGLNLSIATLPILDNNDFIYKKSGDASISGNVVVDINNNGVVDLNFTKTGDLPIEHVVVELHKGAISATPYKSVQTNAKGYYSFSGLDLNSSYIVRMVTPSGYGVIKNANSATTNTLNPIAIGAVPLSVSNQYFLLAGGSNNNPAGGNSHSAATSSGIAGQTLVDDGANTPLPNVLLGLINSSGVEIVRQISDSSGNYHFYNLPSDTYKVNVISSPAGYAIVRNADGTTQPLDTLSGIALTTSGVSGKSFWHKTASVDGIQGQVYVDFADATTTTASLDSHAHLFNDTVTVELYDGIGATGTKLMTTTTVNGKYQFPNLIFGTGVNYSVKIILTGVTDYDFKLSKSGNTSTDVVIDVVNLPSAGSLDNHYVLKGKQKITGDVWVDEDGNLTQATSELLNGVTVTLAYKAPKASTYTTLKTTTTATVSGSNGQYSFTALPKGTDYKVTVDSSSTVLAGTSLIPATGTGSITNNTNVFEHTALASDVTGQSTAYKYNGVISGQFIIDIDGNQAKSAIDTDFAGVKLELKATIGGAVITKTATTDADGKFSIDNLPIGSWVLNVAPDASQTVTNWTSYTLSYSKDSAGTKVKGSTALPLTMAITATKATFANIEVGYNGGAKISGYVVLDVDPTDGPNAVVGTDTPVKNLTMTLSSDTAGFVSRTVTTDTNGYYEFTGLGIHTYKVSVDTTDTQLLGHLISFDPLSTPTSTTSSSSVNLAIAAVNSSLTTQDFGYKSGGSLSGYIYLDISGSGVRHAAVDPKFAGVKIKATQGSTIRYSDLTIANGEYKIDNLSTGKWTIEIDTLPSTDYSYSYVADEFGTTATVVTDGVEVDILPTAPFSGVKGATVSFGVKASAGISGKVVIDVDDQDPAPPASPNITASDIDIDSAGFFPTYIVSLYQGKTLLATKTVASGNYAFTGLSNSITYTVTALKPSSNYINSFTLTSSDTGVTAGTVVNTAASMSQTYTLAATNTQAQNSHFAWKGAGGISGEVFWDKDDDGVFNSSIDSDLGAIITITLSHPSASVPNVTRTIASGSTSYTATGLFPGEWTVSTSGVPTTFKASFDPDDAYNASRLATTANTAKITVAGITKTGQHFGYIKGGAMVGEVKDDATASGIYNSAHVGINPVEVSLLDTSDAAILDVAGNPIKTDTNAAGAFSFRNLDPTINYHVRVLFGSAAEAISASHPLGSMEPSYDSQVSTISLTPPVSSTVDTVNETHTILADIIGAPNQSIELGHLFFGYRGFSGDLTINKKALKDNVVVGDIVPYTITIENNKAITAFNVSIKDLIPPGFKYVKGSARLDGKKIADPTGGRPVFFGPMNVGGQGAGSPYPTKRTLTYMLVVGAGVTQGEYKNVATAVDRTGKSASNTSQAKVTVISDPLFDNALIFGKVYVDRNGNGVQDEDEEGLSGVKLVTVRGEIITTDALGRYHLAGVNGGRWERGTNFVLKLDTRSLPKGYKVIGRNPVVVRLSPGLPSKIDFKVSEEK